MKPTIKLLFIIIFSLTKPTISFGLVFSLTSNSLFVSNPNLIDTLHNDFDILLKKYVSEDGNVNYNKFIKDKTKLQAYIQLLSKVKVNNLTRNQQMAFWINAYNALIIDIILSNYPIKSIKNIYNGKVWDMPLAYKFEGKILTLNNIETEKLLQKFNDARIHFVINCAAKSCPKLINKALTASNIEQLLNANTLAFINNSNKNKFSNTNVLLSQIFNWYKIDFVKADGSINAFINNYAQKKIKQNQTVQFLEYNWDLNN